MLAAETNTGAEKPSGWRYRLWRARFLLLALCFLFAGLTLELVVAFVHFSPQLHELVRDVGITLLIAGTVGLGLELYTRRDFLELVSVKLGEAIESSAVSRKMDDLVQLFSAVNDLQALGVRRIHRRRPYNLFYELVEEAGAGTEIKVMGVCLMSLNEGKMRELISEKLKQGCKIKLMMLDPASPAVAERAEDERRKYKEVKAEIEASDRLHRVFVEEGTSEEGRHNMEIGYYSYYPNYFLFCTDKASVVGFYLRDQRGEEFPHLELEVRGGGMCIPFLKHFDSAWEARRANETPMLPFGSRPPGPA